MDKLNELKINTLFALPLCPKCGSESLRNSSKRSKNTLFYILFYKSYRCRVCHYRFENFTLSRIFLSVGVLAFLLLLAISSLLLINHESAYETLNNRIAATAKTGDPDAELEMGLHYKGHNEQEAIRWFEKSAQHGNTQAKYHYGLALFDGNGIIQNYKDGIRWLEQAAKSGHAKAQFTMGEIYYQGIGVPKDNIRAYMWFMLAAAQNESSAAYMRDKLAGKLSLEQISLMQEEAKNITTTQRSEQAKQ